MLVEAAAVWLEGWTMSYTSSLRLLVGLACLVGTSPLHANVMAFDDINLAPAGSVFISNGYAGLNWVNFGALNTTTFMPSGYVNGTVSSPNVAFNYDGTP